jgi:hypothetical protein
MSFWKWSLQPKHVKDERLKKHNINQSHWTALILFYAITSVTDQDEPSRSNFYLIQRALSHYIRVLITVQRNKNVIRVVCCM